MKKLLLLFLAVAGLAAAPMTQASAGEIPTVPATTGLPAVVHLDDTVVIRHHRHFRTVRHVYYRHGVRHVVLRRVYY